MSHALKSMDFGREGGGGELPFTVFTALKVVGNEKEGGSGRWQMIGIGLGTRRLRFVFLLIFLSSLILCISISAPLKQNQ